MLQMQEALENVLKQRCHETTRRILYTKSDNARMLLYNSQKIHTGIGYNFFGITCLNKLPINTC